MKRYAFLCFGLFLLLPACRWLGVRGNGHIVTDQRSIEEFSELHAGGSFDVEWRAGSPRLSITTDENLLPLIKSQIEGDTLRLRTREHILPTHGVKVVVSSSRRNGAKLTGASELIAHDLSGDKFAVQTTGAADVKLDGNINELWADMTGASELTAKNLQTRTAGISTTGAASADISVSETLKVDITGAGEVIFHGNPVVSKRVTGAGEVRRKD